MTTNMNILITGGFGFIGTHLTEHYLDRGNSVTVIDNLSTSVTNKDSSIFKSHKDRLTFFNWDLSNVLEKEQKELEALIQESDLIYHLASPIGVKKIDKNPQKSIIDGNNITNYLFPLFEKYNKKVVFTSTSEVYGNRTDAKESDTLQIGSPDILRWGYACHKLMSEFLLKSYSFPSVIIRLFNVSGKLQTGIHGMVLPSFIEKAKNNEDLIVYNDGNQIRSFCDIRDAIEMIRILGESNEHNGETYNVGNVDNKITIKELANFVIDEVGSQSKIELVPYNKVFSKNSVDIDLRSPNTDKISRFYTCKYNIKDIIRNMID